jgi:aminoglycoside phosphotransferase (APT) family kinase protein
VRCERPSEGFSSETVLCEALAHDGTIDSFVVRLPPLGPGAFPDYDLVLQAEAQNLVAAAGVPAPAPAEVVDDIEYLGSPFLAMPMVRGHVPGSVALLDRWIKRADHDERAHLYGELVAQLAAIHHVDVDGANALPRRTIADELAYWQHYLDWYADGRQVVPVLDDALDWCRVHQPVVEPVATLLWGDVRLGNVVFGDDRRPVAVLDWEMASIGAPEHDVAWWLSLEAIQDELFGRRVDGFPPIADARQQYEAAVGRELIAIEWFEVFAMMRSTAVMTRLALLHEWAGLEALFPIEDNPVVPLLARRIESAA